MTKSELITKWQEEIEYANAKAVNSLTPNQKAWFSSRLDTISEMIEDIKNLNGATVKPVKGCLNCKHGSLDREEYPCGGCDTEYSRWQPE